MNALLKIAGALLLAAALPAQANTDQDILGLVQTTADQVLSRVMERRDELEQHPELVGPAVSDLVVERFDFEAMTQSAMGKYWPRSEPAQRDQVVSEFQALLIRTYGAALLRYSGKPIEYGTLKWSKDGKRALVPTKVEPSAGPAVPIDYKLHQVAGAWKVYDVVIDNISLVTNYRSTFANEIRNGGVDGLIRKLRARNQAAAG